VGLNPFDDHHAATKTKAGLIYAVLLCANLAVWLWALVAFSERPALLGSALLAYVLGLRHAFDADHIAAIDSVVRKLMQEGKAPYSVGFFFSLGHSTIVVLASVAIAGAASALQAKLAAFHDIGSLIGTLVSASFLLAIGIANLLVLRGVWAALVRVRRGEPIADESLDALLTGGGPLARIFRPVFRVVTRSWHMYPVGFLFGLGFDTATEVGLLGISANQAAQGLSFWTILVFPALFTAGMSLMDTTDSVLMTRAYGWALLLPVRKLWYNLTMTAASVAVALFIGGVEAYGVVGDKLKLEGSVLNTVIALTDNFSRFGFAVVFVFFTSWAVSSLVYRARSYRR
jgi:high-affinity nickel-transport protein